jgi:hypothetical protein
MSNQQPCVRACIVVLLGVFTGPKNGCQKAELALIDFLHFCFCFCILFLLFFFFFFLLTLSFHCLFGLIYYFTAVLFCFFFFFFFFFFLFLVQAVFLSSIKV